MTFLSWMHFYADLLPAKHGFNSFTAIYGSNITEKYLELCGLKKVSSLNRPGSNNE
jgi:hypothetical protein